MSSGAREVEHIDSPDIGKVGIALSSAYGSERKLRGDLVPIVQRFHKEH